MQISIKWLKEYIDFTETPEELADKLTMAGIPVENVIHVGAGLDNVITGRIEKLEQHQNSDHLQICTMNIGTADSLTIVTGAQNVAVGQIVPVAMIGANLPNGMKISKGKLRGVVSMGMLCSARELMLDASTLTQEQLDGIFILPADTPVGIPVKEVLGLDDVVLEFELTANRGDCFSAFGIVREIAVLTGNKPKWPLIEVNEDDSAKATDMVKIGISANDLCSRFSARVLKNVKITSSPKWMQRYLEGAGIRAINNIVDVTNFVMIELGQPMHAYDYDEIKGASLMARRAVKGENLHTLDDSSRLAKGTELVIADAEKAAGLAGIMGGLETEITEKTKTVVLEAAVFNGPNIRRTARSCGLHSEASGRFERGVDATGTIRALNRAAQLLQNMGACTVCPGVIDVCPEKSEPIVVTFTDKQINDRLGTLIPADKMTDILESLGFQVEKSDMAYKATVPSWRNDVTCMDDLSEEIARIYGFDNIRSTTPYGRVVMAYQSDTQDFIDKMKEIFCRQGLNETVSLSFTHPSMFDKLNIPQDSMLRQAVPIMNPLTDEYPLVRTTLLSCIFENAVRNFSRKNTDIRLFEIAPVFYPKALPITEQPNEVIKAAGIISGRRSPLSWNLGNESVDFYDAKGIIEELFDGLRITNYKVEAGEHYAMHPGKTAVFKKGCDVLATVGEVHPIVSANFEIAKKMYIFELDVKTLMKYAAKKHTCSTLPKYPAVTRDLAIIVDKDIPATDIEASIVKNGGKDFKGSCLFDVYTGQQIDERKKSLAFTMQFQSQERTLIDEEIDSSFAKIVEAVARDFDAELRA